MTLLTSWKLDPFTVMRLNSGRGERGERVGGRAGGSGVRVMAQPE